MDLNTNKKEGDKLHAEEWNELVQEVQGKQSRLNIVDALDSTSSADVLSAKQGKILNDKINSTLTAVETISKKVDKFPTGYYYGQFDSVNSLPDASQLTQKGYAYIASEDASVYYIYLFNGEGSSWEDSGNKFVTTELESDLETKSQTKAPTTKAVADSIESVNLTISRNQEQENELTPDQKFNASANISDRGADVAPVTGEVRALGYKILNPALSFASQVVSENTIYEIRDNFDLQGQDVTLGSNSILRFNGGQLIDSSSNHTGRIRCKKIEAKFSDLGLQPGLSVSETVAKNNLHYLKILEYVENIVLSLDDNYTLHSTYATISGSTVSYPAVFNGNLKIEGNNYTLKIYNKTIFEINNNCTFQNCSVINNDTSSNCTLFYIPDTDNTIDKKSDFIVDNCTFEGNIRIITCYRKATTTNYNKGIGLFKVTGCTFNKVYTSSGSNIGIYMDDSLCELVIINNNIVHNLFCQLFSFATSNGTDANNAVKNSGLNGKRTLEINNNTIYNDEDWTPSDESSWRAPTYYTFIVAEGGYIHYNFNSFTNIIYTESNSAVYDSYLSCLTLLYENNFVKNVFEISKTTSKLHELLKSKTGGNYQYALRTYKNNSYIQESIDVINERYILNHPNTTAKYADYMEYNNHFFSEANYKNLIIDNNTFTLYSFYTQRNYLPSTADVGIEKFTFTNNSFKVNKVVGPTTSGNVYAGCVLFNFRAETIETVTISNNLISMTDDYNPGWESNIVTKIKDISAVSEFLEESSYSTDDIVSYNTKYYVFVNGHNGEWDSTDVTEIINYKDTSDYAINNLVIYNDSIWKFTASKTKSKVQELALLAIRYLSFGTENFKSILLSNNTLDNVALTNNSGYPITGFIESNTFKNTHLRPFMFTQLYNCKYNNNTFQITGSQLGSASLAYWFRFTPYFKAKIISEVSAAGGTTIISHAVPSDYIDSTSSTNYCIETLNLEVKGERYIFQTLKHFITGSNIYTDEIYLIHSITGELIKTERATASAVSNYAIMPLNCNSTTREKFKVSSSGVVGNGGVSLYKSRDGFNGFNITKFITNKTFTIEYKNDFYNELPLGKLIPQTYVTNFANLPSIGENGTAPLFNLQNGTKIYVESLKANAIWNGTNWELESTKGDSNSRPVLTSGNIGAMYFDTSLGKPIYWNGEAWIDSNGETIGLQVKDTTILLEASASSKTINVYSSSAITATAQNPDGSTTDLWLTASVGSLTSGAYPVTLTATSANSTNPRGAKVIISNGTDVVIVNVVQNYV